MQCEKGTEGGEEVSHPLTIQMTPFPLTLVLGPSFFLGSKKALFEFGSDLTPWLSKHWCICRRERKAQIPNIYSMAGPIPRKR